MTLRTYLLGISLSTLVLGCDTAESDSGQEPSATTKADAGGKGPAPEPYDCEEGFELVESVSECLADASCYEVPDGTWCTGLCPEGSELDESDPPQCEDTDTDIACTDGFEPVDDIGSCLADASCYELADGSWCTGVCPEGSELDESDPPQCVDPDTNYACADGYEPVDDIGSCYADAACYELPDGSWCSGLCPPGQQLNGAEPPQCEDAPFGGCLPGFEFTETETGCIADAVCYEEPPYGWCTGECPDGGMFVLSEVGPSCI